MRFDTTNPFTRHPKRLAHLPRIVRLYILHAMVGFVLSGLFTGLVLGLDVGRIGHLVANVSGGWLAGLVFFTLNGIVFAGAQTAIVVMGLGHTGRGGGGCAPAPLPVRVRAD